MAFFRVNVAENSRSYEILFFLRIFFMFENNVNVLEKNGKKLYKILNFYLTDFLLLN